MANVVLNPGQGGASISTETIAGIDLPRGKIVTGASGADGGDVTATNPLAVNAIPLRGNKTDRSGIITLGGTKQTLMASNAARNGMLVQNNGTAKLWINWTTDAVQSQPSLLIDIGATYIEESSHVSGELISIIGPTTNQAFTAKEW